jgi:hypothetical protein
MEPKLTTAAHLRDVLDELKGMEPPLQGPRMSRRATLVEAAS